MMEKANAMGDLYAARTMLAAAPNCSIPAREVGRKPCISGVPGFFIVFHTGINAHLISTYRTTRNAHIDYNWLPSYPAPTDNQDLAVLRWCDRRIGS